MKLHGTNAVITGGSRGLGREIGRRLAFAGAGVVLVARRRGPLEDAVASIRREGGRAYGIAADVGEKEDVYRIAGEAAALVGDVDIAVHNASALGPTPLPLFMDTECEDLQRVLEANLVGPFRLTKALAGPMVVRGRGTVVAISSDAGADAIPRWGAYGVSKAALDHMTRVVAAELEGTGVRLFSVDPGEMNTAMHFEAVPDADPADLADPADVATAIVDMLRDDERAPSGARLSASAWRRAA